MSETNELKKDKHPDYIPEERLREILNILLPYGYSYNKHHYTGLSPYIGDATNIITVIANEEALSSVFAICMEKLDENSNENDIFGFYMCLMKLIAPEFESYDEKFTGHLNMLCFHWADEVVQDNKFPVKVTYQQPF